MGNSCSIANSLLSEVEKGKQVQVVKVTGQDSLKRRVLDMGIVPGTLLTVQRKAPLNDPVSVWFRGYELSLRKSEAESVVVKPVGSSACSSCKARCF
jgi:ferrous iron transport protein A